MAAVAVGVATSVIGGFVTRSLAGSAPKAPGESAETKARRSYLNKIVAGETDPASVKRLHDQGERQAEGLAGAVSGIRGRDTGSISRLLKKQQEVQGRQLNQDVVRTQQQEQEFARKELSGLDVAEDRRRFADYKNKLAQHTADRNTYGRGIDKYLPGAIDAGIKKFGDKSGTGSVVGNTGYTPSAPGTGSTAAQRAGNIGLNKGGYVPHMDEGGKVPAIPGSIPGKDSVLASLTPGELVLPEEDAVVLETALDSLDQIQETLVRLKNKNRG